MEKKLTKKEIQFIDNYLLKADIHYEDLRIEMIDHVASEIEHQMKEGDQRGFYDIFKDYMIANKHSLEKQANKFKISGLKNMAILFLKNLYSWQVILGIVVCFFLFKSFESFFYGLEDLSFTVFFISPFIVILCIPFFINGKKKYSFIRSFSLILMCFYLTNLLVMDYFEHHSEVLHLYVGFLIVVLTVSSKTILDLSLVYKKRFLSVS